MEHSINCYKLSMLVDSSSVCTQQLLFIICKSASIFRITIDLSRWHRNMRNSHRKDERLQIQLALVGTRMDAEHRDLVRVSKREYRLGRCRILERVG